MLVLNREEKAIAATIKRLKDEAGSHSPSVFTLSKELPSLKMKVDACFLSNPYATDLFLRYLEDDIITKNKLRNILEFYPSQNKVIAEILSKHLRIPSDFIIMGNGAIETIQAVIHNFVKRKVLINLPTFSSYYEFTKEGVEVIYNNLKKTNNFQLDLEQFIQLVKAEKPDTIVLINPNNPTGSYTELADINYLLEELQEVENIIIDESFIHFSFEDNTYSFKSAEGLVQAYDNLIIIKSMSKDFGIAGIRGGYALMRPEKVTFLLKNGYLWNLSGLAEYFFNLYVKDSFYQEYEKIRVKFIKEAQEFFTNLSAIKQIKTYPTFANFILIELVDGSKCDDFCYKLLIRHGIYTRTCADKIGLDGEFVRIAARSKIENQMIIDSIQEIFLC